MSDWLENSDNANTLKSSYIQGVLDVSGDIIMRNSDQAFINMRATHHLTENFMHLKIQLLEKKWTTLKML